jgi:tetratricopeptide (TPR) repeat protein
MHQECGLAIEAVEYYRLSLAIVEKLADANPTDGQAQVDLAATHGGIAHVQKQLRQYEQAIESYGRALKVLRTLQEQGRLPEVNGRWIGIIEQAIQFCRHAPTAFGEWEMLLAQPATMLPELLELRAMQFGEQGRFDDAVQAVAKLRQLGTATPEQLYNAARVYCWCAAGIKAGKDDLEAEDSAARQQHIADALATLREAIAAGWRSFARLDQDPDLAVLRDLPAFHALVPR